MPRVLDLTANNQRSAIDLEHRPRGVGIRHQEQDRVGQVFRLADAPDR
jgi:hypothetical protein